MNMHTIFQPLSHTMQTRLNTKSPNFMRAFRRIFAHCSVTVTRIKFCFFFALIPCYQGASVNYHKQWYFSSLIFDFKGGAADFFKCTFQCEYALLNFFLLINMSYFCEYHWNPIELKWYLDFFNSSDIWEQQGTGPMTRTASHFAPHLFKNRTKL